MTLGTLEILATILIVFSVIKLLVIWYDPKAWMNFAKNLYTTKSIQWILLVLAVIVLYYLLQAGVTIVHILAITLFIALVVAVELAPYIPKIMKMFDVKHLWRDHWLSIVIWVVLLAWGAKVMYFP